MRRLTLLSLLLLCCLAQRFPSGARAARIPSPELSFRVELSPDSITVGDPITLVLEASAPSDARLGLPQLADSIGPFSVLSAQTPATSLKEGRLVVRQEGQVTLFRTGEYTFPELELLWERAPGETLVAYSQARTVRVPSVLEGEADLSKLRGIKGVIPLDKFRLWLWAAVALLAAALAFLVWRYRHLLARKTKLLPLAPPPPPLPPEVAFERGLTEIYRRELPERGLVKEFYAELSLLFRRYLEDRFRFPAVEETRTEILLAATRVTELRESDRAELADWLAEGDLVKFAKLERLITEARVYAERARAFVHRTAAAVEVPAVGEGQAPPAPGRPATPGQPAASGRPATPGHPAASDQPAASGQPAAPDQPTPPDSSSAPTPTRGMEVRP